MTELDLLLIRHREHEIAALELKQLLANLQSQPTEAIRFAFSAASLEKEKCSHIERLEATGIDYFTITAEMARIRAEVRGEK